MAAVVDASVAIKWVLAEAGSDAARRLILAESGMLSAPALILAECGNTHWHKVRRGELGAPDARARFESLGRTPLRLLPDEELVPDEELASRAFGLALEIDHPIYDCLCLAAALEAGQAVVTADRRFARAVAAHRSDADRVRLQEQP
jgi:predicted nucleic acid-binding protein